MRTGIHFLFGSLNGENDFKYLIDKFSNIGFNCIELPPDPFLNDNGTYARDIVKYAAEKDMEIVFSTGFPADKDMASNDINTRIKGADYLKAILDVMNSAQIKFIGGTCYTKWPSYRQTLITLLEKQELTYRTAECFKEAISGIDETNIEIAIEPLNRFEGFMINTAAEAVDFCKLVDSKNVGVMLDGFHSSVEEDDVANAVYIAGPYLKHLHLAENNRKLPGMGTFPWDKYFKALKEINYSGRFDIESFMTPEGSVAASVGLWRALNDKPELELLKDSIDFIRCKVETIFTK